MFLTYQLMFLLPLPTLSFLHQSFLAPLNDVNADASQIIFSSGSFNHHPRHHHHHQEEEEEAVSAPSTLLAAPSEIITDYVQPSNRKREIPSKISNDESDDEDPEDSINHSDKEDVFENIMRGSYAYVGADGLPYMINWTADDEGFHPSVPHLSNYVELVTDLEPEDVSSDDAEEVINTAENVLEDDSTYDEIFTISGNDFPAFSDEVMESQIL